MSGYLHTLKIAQPPGMETGHVFIGSTMVNAEKKKISGNHEDDSTKTSRRIKYKGWTEYITIGRGK